MKSLFQLLLLVAVLSFVFNQPVFGQSRRDDTLTNVSIVKLSKAGFKEKSIISIIFSRASSFDLSADRLIELKRGGVSEKVIMAMLAKQQGAAEFDEDNWTDDSVQRNGGSQGSGSNDGVGADIFGSSSGQRSKNQTNRSGGSSTGDTVTTGSATVRILRPPSEAGESSKLEKTRSLNNDSIVELVEAGFSEGTIIRRIEQSPVEFDLAAPKIEELRKRRVTDKILAAMKAAMGEESAK